MTASDTKVGTEGRIDFFGASVRGPAHCHSRSPREDAWRGTHLSDKGGVVVVADGMGSRNEAARGAHKATRAAVKAFRCWSRTTAVEAEWMLRWLESQWRFEIAPSAPRDCATTCLFAGWTTNNGLVMSGLGDGMILLREGNGPVQKILTRDESLSLNETKALGCNHRLGDWTTLSKKPKSPWSAILMTDGVAEDLRPDKLEELCTWLIDDVAKRAPRERSRMLRDALVNWPTPGHSDDKTIAVILSA